SGGRGGGATSGRAWTARVQRPMLVAVPVRDQVLADGALGDEEGPREVPGTERGPRCINIADLHRAREQGSATAQTASTGDEVVGGGPLADEDRRPAAVEVPVVALP